MENNELIDYIIKQLTNRKIVHEKDYDDFNDFSMAQYAIGVRIDELDQVIRIINNVKGDII